MSDNANKMGTSMESIQNAYQGFAKQNYTMLDNLKLGYGGTKEEMERLIEDANRVKEANGEMADLSIDSFADVTEAIHIIQTEMGITGTTATEASTTIEGSVNSMKSAWENLVTDLGKGNADIGESVDELMDSVETALDNIIPAVQQILENITTAIPEIIPRVIEGLSSIITEVLPSLL
jgi:phage-related protein